MSSKRSDTPKVAKSRLTKLSEVVNQIEKLREEGNYQSVIELTKEAISLYKLPKEERCTANFILGEAYFLNGEQEEGYKILQNVEKDPNNGDCIILTLQYLSNFYNFLFSFIKPQVYLDNSIKYATKGIALLKNKKDSTNKGIFYCYRGMAYSFKNKNQKALKDIRTAIKYLDGKIQKIVLIMKWGILNNNKQHSELLEEIKDYFIDEDLKYIAGMFYLYCLIETEADWEEKARRYYASIKRHLPNYKSLLFTSNNLSLPDKPLLFANYLSLNIICILSNDLKRALNYLSVLINNFPKNQLLLKFQCMIHLALNKEKLCLQGLSEIKNLIISDDQNFNQFDFILNLASKWYEKFDNVSFELKIATESTSIEFLVKAFSILFSVKMPKTVISCTKLIGNMIDKYPAKIIPNERLEKSLREIYEYYPVEINNINEQLFLDKKNIFRLRSKLTFIKYFINHLLEKENIDTTIFLDWYIPINDEIHSRLSLSIKKRDEELEQAKLEKERMIQQYSHTLANTLNPNTIFEVANRLKKHAEFQKDARFLTDAYHAETIIRNQGLLLQARNTGSSAEFQQLIRGDRLPEDTREKAISIEEILNNAIERIIARFLNSDYHKLDPIRQRICERKQMTLSVMKNSFEENVFFKPRQSAIDWVSQNIAENSKTLSPMWRSIRLRRDGYAEALLQGYFGELLFNALKYRDIEQDVWVNIKFFEEEFESRTFLVCEWENPYTQNVSISTGKGLEGIQNDLEMLNDIREKDKVFTWREENGKFRVMLRFLKDLFVPYKPKIELDSERLAKQLNKEKKR